MQLIKVVSGSPFKVGERSGKTPRCEGYSRRWRKCTGGAVYSNFDVFLQEQTAAVVSCLDDSTHLVPFGGFEGLPHPTTALTSGVFVTGRKCRPSESSSKDKVLVRFSFFFFFGLLLRTSSSAPLIKNTRLWVSSSKKNPGAETMGAFRQIPAVFC